MTHKIGPLVATGRTADIHLWNGTNIVKVFREWVSLEAVTLELRAAKAVYDAGLPVPAVGETIKVNNRIGLIYERIEGTSMLEALGRRPWNILKYAEQLAHLHARTHACIVPEIPPLHRCLENKIRSARALPDRLKEKVLLLLDKMPDGNYLCHGDFHPGNIILTGKGPIIIDWIDSSQGNPLADVARTSLLARLAYLPKGMPSRQLFGVTRHWFNRIYLNHYFKVNQVSRDGFMDWLIINAAARLAENIHEEQSHLVNMIEAELGQ